jgi:hypothetical protein
MAIVPVMVEKTVTTAGTRVQVSTSTVYVSSIFCETPRGNTGYIYIGGSAVSSTVFFHEFAIGKDTWSMTSPLAGDGRVPVNAINLSDLWIDSSVNGEKVKITYLPVQGA